MKRRAFFRLLGGAGALAVTACNDSNTSSRLAQAEARLIEATHAIKIGWTPPSSLSMSRAQATKGLPASTWATPVYPAGALIALQEIATELNKYPSGFFASLCATIFLCDLLMMEGVPAGGSYGANWIILLAGKNLSEQTIRETVRLGVHHEFSSLVFVADPALQAAWSLQMPKGWAPTGSNAAALAHNADPPPARITGVLSSYGKTSIENDFNTYAEKIFTQPQELRKLCETYPLIAYKTHLVLKSYFQRDQRFKVLFEQWGLRDLLQTVNQPEINLSPLLIPNGQVIKR